MGSRATAVIFDLDGTLIDSLADIARALNETLAAEGLPTHGLETVRGLVGYGAGELVRGALPADRRDDGALFAETLRAYRARYRAGLVIDTRPYEGIEALLDALEARGVRKAILTNKPHDVTEEIVAKLLGRFRWEAVVGQRDGVPHKPDPGGALAIARTVGIEPRGFSFVGDGDTDMRTARNAGMTAIGCLWGLRDADALRDAGAQHLIAHPRELLELMR